MLEHIAKHRQQINDNICKSFGDDLEKGGKAVPIGTIYVSPRSGRKKIKTATGWERYKETANVTKDTVQQYVVKEGYLNLVKSLPEDEYDVVQDYAANAYKKIGVYLRSENPPSNQKVLKAKIAKLDSVIGKNRLTKTVNLYRGVRFSNVDNKFANLKVGDVIDEPNYTSTSLLQERANVFTENAGFLKIKGGKKGSTGYTMKIRASKGQPALPYITSGQIKRENDGVIDCEYEVILPRGLKYKVIDIADNIITVDIKTNDS